LKLRVKLKLRVNLKVNVGVRVKERVNINFRVSSFYSCVLRKLQKDVVDRTSCVSCVCCNRQTE